MQFWNMWFRILDDALLTGRRILLYSVIAPWWTSWSLISLCRMIKHRVVLVIEVKIMALVVEAMLLCHLTTVVVPCPHIPMHKAWVGFLVGLALWDLVWWWRRYSQILCRIVTRSIKVMRYIVIYRVWFLVCTGFIDMLFAKCESVVILFILWHLLLSLDLLSIILINSQQIGQWFILWVDVGVNLLLRFILWMSVE